MKKTESNRLTLSLTMAVLLFLTTGFVFSQVDRFQVREGGALEVWRITDAERVNNFETLW